MVRAAPAKAEDVPDLSNTQQAVPGPLSARDRPAVPSDLAILVPVLHRPRNVLPLVQNVEEVHPDATIWFIAEESDEAENDAICQVGWDLKYEVGVARLVVPDGTNYAAKINYGVRETSEALLFFGADDLRFHEGWFGAATRHLSNEIGVVGTNDLCNPKVMAGKHATHFLVARWYAELLGSIDNPEQVLHEGYRHEWVDNEFLETAQYRHAYAHAGDSIVEHLHPMTGKAEMDELYAGMPDRMAYGERIFRRRRLMWQSAD